MLKLVDDYVLVNNDRILLESKTLPPQLHRKIRPAASLLVVVEDNFNSTPWEQTFEFNGNDSGDDDDGKTTGIISPVNPGSITPIAR